MPLLRRHEDTATHHAVPAEPESPDMSALRDETDPDPVVEEAAARLRAALTSLDARDEWGRPLAWRQVARIAIGPLGAQLRDAHTAAALSSATGAAMPLPLEPELFATQRSSEDSDSDLPFGIA